MTWSIRRSGEETASWISARRGGGFRREREREQGASVKSEVPLWVSRAPVVLEAMISQVALWAVLATLSFLTSHKLIVPWPLLDWVLVFKPSLILEASYCIIQVMLVIPAWICHPIITRKTPGWGAKHIQMASSLTDRPLKQRMAHAF